MKKFFTLPVIIPVLIAVFSGKAEAQCTPLSTSYWGEMLPNAGCGVFASYSPFGPGQYFRMPVLQGGSYTISTCGAPINTQMTGFQQGNNGTPVFYNDDNGPDCTGGNASVTYTSSFSDYLNVNVSEYNCLPGGSSSITVKVRQNDNLAITSSTADMCEGDVRTLTATPLAVTGTVQPGSGSTGVFSGTGVSGTTFTAPAPAGNSQVYLITYSFGYCSTTQTITVWHAPSGASAGTDQTICDSTATISANNPAFGSGTWSIVSGPGSIVSPASASTTVTGLVEGQVTICRWTIVNGPCTSSFDDVSITRQSGASPSMAGTDQTVCNATATLGANTPAIGIGTWTLVSGSGTPTSPNSPTSGVTGLGFGQNIFSWTITNGSCTSTTDDVTITRNPTVTAGISSSTDVSCFGDSDGSATVTPGGGDGNFIYSWSPSGGSTATETGLSGGTYMVTVTDGNTCSATASVTINEPASLSVGMVVTDASCSGTATGSIDLSVAGGFPGFTYLWNNNDTTEDLTDAVAGTYSVTVTDAHNCTATGSATIINPVPVSISAVVVEPACHGGSDGEINLTVLGGTGAYSYDWSTGDSTTAITGLAAGSYTVTVTDAAGCTATSASVVDEPSALVLTADVTDETNGNDGSIDLTVSGGVPLYEYSWSSGQTSQDIEELPAGNYTVTVTDAHGCTKTFTTAVNGSSGVSQDTDALNVSIYPNPGTGKFNVTVAHPASGELRITIMDISGRQVAQVKTMKDASALVQEMDITRQPGGVYLVTVELEGGGRFTKRIIKR